MSNMSYCRFRNTSNDLLDCAQNIEAKLSSAEHRARLQMLDTIADLLEELAIEIDREQYDAAVERLEQVQAGDDSNDDEEG